MKYLNVIIRRLIILIVECGLVFGIAKLANPPHGTLIMIILILYFVIFNTINTCQEIYYLYKNYNEYVEDFGLKIYMKIRNKFIK